MKHRLAGSTDVTEYFNLELAADGTPATGLTITDLDLQYVRSGAAPAAKVDATALAATDSAHGDNQAIEIDATDQPGLYRVDWPDAAFASGVGEVVLTVKGATIRPSHLRVNLTPVPSDVRQIGGDAQSMTDLKDFADAGYDPSTNKVQGVVLVDTLTTYTGNTPQTGDSFARLGAPAGASVSADVAAVKAETATIVADTNELQTDWVNGGRLDLIVDAILEDTGTTLQAELDGIQADTEDIQTRLPAALVGGRIDATVDGTGMESGAINAIIEACFTYDATATYAGADAGSLVKQIADNAGGSSLTAADIADAVWEEAVADHSGTSGSTAEALAAAGGAGDPWITTLPGSYTGSQAGKILADILVDTGTTLQGELDGIQADTEDIQSRLPAALVSGRMDASVGAMAANTLTASALATDAVTEIQSGLATSASIAALNDLSSAEAQAAAEAAIAASDVATNTDLDALIATVGVAGAGLTEAGGTGDHLTALATAAALATVDSEVGVIDGIVDSILVDTTQIKADLPSRPTKAAQFDNLMFLMVDETDLATPETGVTVTATISKDGGAFAACTNAASEVSGGWYKITLTSTEMNADSIAVKFTGTGCAQRNLAIRTQP